VIRGGVIRPPRNPDWSVPGIPLEAGAMYACMAETILMGLEGRRVDGSLGSLTPEHVRCTGAWARKHGFTILRPTVETVYESSFEYSR
jgi:predicted amino acid dehydrogenase